MFLTAFNSIFTLMVIMAIGCFLRKRNIVGDESSAILSTIEVNVLMPALIFSTFAENFTLETISLHTMDIVWSCGTLVASFGLSFVVAKIMGKESGLYDVILYGLTIPNIGYIGYPMVEAVWGAEALFRMMIFCIPYNIVIYTFGIYILHPDKVLNLKKLCNPTMIAMLVGAAVGLLRIPIPGVVTSVVSTLKVCMAPIAMLLSGIVIARRPLKKLVCSCKMYIIAVIKNILIPALLGGVLYLCGLRGELLCIATATVSMPIGLNSIVFPEAYGGDGTYGAQACFISNILAILSVPAVFYILNLVA